MRTCKNNVLNTTVLRKYLIWNRSCIALLTLLSLLLFSAASQAEQDEFDIWVKDAPLSLVVEQLAGMTGTTLEETTALRDKVSGTFSGTLREILSAISVDHDLLFHLQNSVLHVSDKRSATSATLSIPPTGFDAAAQQVWQRFQSPGNSVVVDGNKAILSGHPEFVNLMTAKVTSKTKELSSQIAVNNQQWEEATTPSQNAEIAVLKNDVAINSESLASMGVNDVATRALLEDRQPEDAKGGVIRSDSSDPVLDSVTDIPGFSTF